MKENYQLALKEVLKSEGGYTNDPRDPGGPTNFGITIHDYRAYINPHGTALDVRHMTVDQAATIYKTKYWDAVKGDTLPSGLDYCLFDYGVNSGVSRANRVADHYIPEQYSHHQDVVWLINQICDERLKFLQSLHTWPHFGKGWGTRVAHVRALSIQMAKAAAPEENEPWYTSLIKNWLPQQKQS